MESEEKHRENTVLCFQFTIKPSVRRRRSATKRTGSRAQRPTFQELQLPSVLHRVPQTTKHVTQIPLLSEATQCQCLAVYPGFHFGGRGHLLTMKRKLHILQYHSVYSFLPSCLSGDCQKTIYYFVHKLIYAVHCSIARQQYTV